MSRYIKISNSESRPNYLTVSNGRLNLDRFSVMLMWAKDLDASKGENLYFRTLTEYYYRQEKGLAIPGTGDIWDKLDQLDEFCYFDVTEIQNAINFINTDILPSLQSYESLNGPDNLIIDNWGGDDLFRSYFELNKDFISINPDFHSNEYWDSANTISFPFRELRDVLEDSLISGNPYRIYIH